jgi:HD superfamily phosphohydrolase
VGEIRDPIYGYIHITDLEEAIIDTPEFQRLDRISQMPTTRLVYPGASNSRKTHAFGTMQLMGKSLMHILAQQSEKTLPYCEPIVLEEDNRLDHLDKIGEEWWDSKDATTLVEIARLAGLLHDIGHGPFNHLLEHVCAKVNIKFDHEERGREIIRYMADRLSSDHPDISDMLKSTLEVLNTEGGKAPLFFRGLISGTFDCDMLDYLQRDAHFAGTYEYGGLDVDRVIDGFRIYEGKLTMSIDALEAMMNFFKSLYSIYSAVYYHRASRILDFMVYDALANVPDLVHEIVEDLPTFLEHDDHSIVHTIKARANGDKNYLLAWSMLKSFRERKKIYKEVFMHRLGLGLMVIPEVDDKLKELTSSLEKKAEGEGLIIHVDAYAVRPLRLHPRAALQWLRTTEFLYDKDGEKLAKRLDEVSTYHTRSLSGYTLMLRIFVDRAKIEEKKGLIEDIKKEAKERIKEIEDLRVAYLRYLQ